MTRKLSLKPLFRATPVRVPAEAEVHLTPEEDRLCTLLDECKHMLEKEGHDVECRIAGGWVRDKLLGAQSNDIDIALSNMMGVTFAEHFVAFVSSQDLPVKSVSTIARNPEQSKHLETARTTVLDVELDFVNLRSEEYAEGSRIPTEVKLGTPLEDALRRDITINALFYNVHSRSVEDFTGKGLEDLERGVLRTPLSPKETFRDDPLRVIRCVRFASRYGFKMVPELEQAARDEEIKNAIVTKISRERVGEELDKMMKGRDPLDSIRIITDLGLHDSLFSLPSLNPSFSAAPAPPSLSLAACTILHSLLSSPSSLQLPPVHPLMMSQLAVDKTLKPRIFLAAALTPFRRVSYAAKKKSVPAIEIVIREAVKLGMQNHYLDGIPALFAAADVLRMPSSDVLAEPNQRSKIGLLLKNKAVHNANTGSHWSSSLLFSLVQELAPLWAVEDDIFDVDQAVATVKLYNQFLETIERLDLPTSIDAKPLLDGNEICTILGASKRGQWTGEVLAKVTEWQLDHPSGLKDECAAWLKEELSAGRIHTDDAPKRDKSAVSTGDGKSKRAKTHN